MSNIFICSTLEKCHILQNLIKEICAGYLVKNMNRYIETEQQTFIFIEESSLLMGLLGRRADTVYVDKELDIMNNNGMLMTILPMMIGNNAMATLIEFDIDDFRLAGTSNI